MGAEEWVEIEDEWNIIQKMLIDPVESSRTINGGEIIITEIMEILDLMRKAKQG